ncbi:hypothetical protein ACFORG_12725 [Lutimaribacter marinistellae]|uniref:Uncharacterized protein n=1 Tax=Lutimaribacter marinistellae TaxID=1820329 RepID=A0ABV7TIA2_9RHOB
MGEICTLHHQTDGAEILLTYDPAKPLYTVTVTLGDGRWLVAPWFAMRFDGRNRIDISTPHHSLSADGSALSVTDTGFGNVLNGLEFNERALAYTPDRAVEFSLQGAAPEVRRFRECKPVPLS